MASGYSEGVRLKPRDNSDPTASSSTFSPDEFPDIEYVEVTPNAAHHEDSGGPIEEIQLNPPDNSDPTAGTSTFSPDEFPDIAHVKAAPNPERHEDPDGRRGAQGTQTKGEAGAQPTSDNKKPRNLVVCIDGTANQFGLKNTNVVELYSRLVADETQLTYYDSGIGTYVAESNPFVRAMQWVENALDMAIALHHKRITLSAYQWLSENYVRGDRIYLFGFSRGAYQVRIIAGMIKIVGLLRKGNNNQIQFAYQLYLAMMKVEKREEVTVQKEDSKTEERKNADPPEQKKNAKVEPAKQAQVKHRDGPGAHLKAKQDVEPKAKEPEQAAVKQPNYTSEMCDQFKRTLCHRDVVVHFVGVWDTVSSIGVTRGTSFPETTNGMLHVRAFRHALSLHELRSKFLPEYGNGGGGPLEGGDVKEVWFAGSHSDIGGGNAENLRSNLFGPPLRWMLFEAMDHGLRVEPYRGGWSPASHHPSMTWVWRIFEAYPWKRLSYNGTGPTAEKRWPPHMSGGRRIQPGQLIHESALEYFKGDGSLDRTKAKILHNNRWLPIQDHPDLLPIEKDAHSKVIGDTIEEANARTAHGPLAVTFIQTIQELVISAAGSQALIDHLDQFNANGANALLDVLQRMSEPRSTSSVGKAIVEGLSKILAEFKSRPDGCNMRLPSSLLRCLQFTDQNTLVQVMHIFGAITGHTNDINSVAYSPNGACIASGSDDRAIRLWDAATGQPIGKPLQGHEDIIYSVAFSPDGKRIVSGSDDYTIRLWDTETHQAVGPPLTGHEDYVRSVTFSPDGKLIASGSDDSTIRIWDAETRHAVGEPLRGHTNWVLSVAFSPDGRRIASGSGDETVRIWDLETHAVVRVLEGHSYWVWSVVFSPDGRRIVSGSYDDTIRVWDAESGETVLGPLSGDSGVVLAVAVSPDGRYIASGSYDGTVRLWDAQTGGAVGEPLRGHTHIVSSVAFSPDSRRVVSGSFDNTLMIWDVEI